MKTAKYFKEAEFQKCTPSCSMQDMDQSFLTILDAIRSLSGVPLLLNSCYRSPAYERTKGRAGTSSHCKGIAADIRCSASGTRYKIVAAAMKLGITRIGIAKTYIHIDTDKTKAQNVIWDYYK